MVMCGAKTRDGSKCRRAPAPGNARCFMHGGATRGAGRPVSTCLYAKAIPDEWRDTLDAFLADSEYLSVRNEIATSRTNHLRYIHMHRGEVLSDDIVQRLIEHEEHISKLTEREGKRLYNERIVNELIASQRQREAAILIEVISRHVDAHTAETIRREFAGRLEEIAGAKPALAKLSEDRT